MPVLSFSQTGTLIVLLGEYICNLPALLYISMGQDIGYAVFHFCRCTPTHRPTDIIGRRPVILAGLTFMMIMNLAFGLSQSLSMVLITRCLGTAYPCLRRFGPASDSCSGGLLSGTVAAVHSALGEMTDTTNQSFAIPIFGLMWPLGAIVGFVSRLQIGHGRLTNFSPLIGGTFAHGASKYPFLFGYSVFEENPYFLPCLLSSLLTFFGVLLGFAFLEEVIHLLSIGSMRLYLYIPDSP